jgi:acetyl esterase/lipase
MSQTSERLRLEFRQGDDIRDAGLETPADIERCDDIAYGDDPLWQALDVYRPKGRGEKLPVIVSIHGGGWVYGDKQRYQYYCMSLAQRGFAVVNFSYRLAPEHKYPAQMEDVNAVFAWVMAHAGEYGMDSGRLFAVGDSAGAHMLALYACICTNLVAKQCHIAYHSVHAAAAFTGGQRRLGDNGVVFVNQTDGDIGAAEINTNAVLHYLTCF